MTPTAAHQDESERLALLQSTHLPGAEGAAAFHALTRLLVQTLGVPGAAIHLVGERDACALAATGLDVCDTARGDSPAAALVEEHQPLRAREWRQDPRLQHLAHAPSMQGWVACAGVPLLVEGQALGAVCAFAPHPRDWTDQDLARLGDVATAAGEIIEGILRARRARRSEERVLGASLAGSDWLWETDDNSQLTWASGGLLQHTGMDPSSEVGLKVTQVITPRDDDTRASWERYLQARARHEPFQDMIAERDTPLGRITVSVSGMPVFDSRGVFRGYRGASRNITLQLAAEQAARRADQLLRKAIETFHMSVMITDQDGRVVLSNREWRKAVGDAFDPASPCWADVVRRLIQAGCYPEAIGREDEFLDWRLNLHRLDQAREVRFKDRWLLVRDETLDDGNTVHFATDVTQTRENAELLRTQQQALHDSEARLSAVLRALPDLWFVIDAQDRYVDGHMDHPQLMGELPQLLGQPVGFHLPDDVATVQRDAVRQARSSGQPQTISYDLHNRDGVLRHFEARATPMPAGQVLYLTTDITDRKIAADKLRVSEELYRSVAAAISDGLIIIDLEGHVVALNPAASRILGLPTDASALPEHVSQGFELLDDDLVAALPAERWPLMEAMRTGQRVVDRVVPARRADHEIVWLQMSANVIRVDRDTAPFAAMATFRDITRERLTVQDLALSEERWKFALEGAGDGVWDWDLPSGCMYYSTRWKQMLGYEDHEITDTPEEYFMRVHPDDRDAVVHSTMRFVTEGVGVQQVEFRLRHRQGHYLHILSRGKVVSRSREGRALRVVGTHSDISVLKQAEQDQRERETAEAASAAKSEFLSRMSHEIRTPLNAITGFAQLMRLQLGQGGTDSPLRNYIEQILHAGRHLSGLVNDVLDLQQVEAGVLNLRLEPITLEDELVQCLSMLLPMAEQREISMSSYIDPDSAVLADRQRLRQVLMNVGSNAIKYNRHGGAVVVRAERQDNDTVRLSLQDTGMGMTPEQLARLYQPFERLGRETSSVEGTGLGLIITRSLIESMGGHMEIDSHPGTGTRVSITLPCAQALSTPLAATQGEAAATDWPLRLVQPSPAAPSIAPSTATSAPAAALAQPSSPVPAAGAGQPPPLRVLYVEDNRINALLFAEALRPYEHIALEIAEDGDIALEMAREQPPHVLVLDAHLPGMSGFEVLGAMRQLPGLADAPAFMCSADAMPEDLDRAKVAGFHGYWTKPIDIEVVTAELNRLAQTIDRVADNAAP
ncbi:MAG: PAS domain S-box protein [Proteobacteria bacterium]|uniref:PAS domain S-box protein n=1 Tax=Aquabacterium sp. TaxID=1872578 RepID=UPI0035C6E8AF|nr:PAS domain S-box protein [Pseudomonadota bacterium]